MATITSYNTTNSLPILALQASSDGTNTIGNYSLSQLLVNGLNNLALFDYNLASEFQTGLYTYGTATDGSFYIKTANYIAFYYGTISALGSSITKVQIDNNTNGALVVVNGSFTYKGLPFPNLITSSHISNIENIYLIDSNHYGSAYLTSDVNLQPNSTKMVGTISQVSVSELTISSGQMLGVNYVGTANISVDPFNLSNTTVSSGQINSMQLTIGNSTSITDSLLVSGISSWNLNTQLNKLALNTGTDTYILTGSLGQKANGGIGNDIITGGDGNDTITGGGGNDSIIGGKGVDTAQYTGSYSNFTVTAIYQGTNKALSGYQVKDNTGVEGTDTLDTTIEYLAFDSGKNVYPINSAVAIINKSPSGTDKTVNFLEDTSFTFSLNDFGFTDSDGNTLSSVKISSLPAVGQLKYNGTAISSSQASGGYEVSATDIVAGKLTYTPTANTNGTAYSSFTFQVRDNGGTSNGGVDLDPTANKLSFSVTAVNDAPTGSVSISGVATQGQTLTVSNTLADADGLGAISYQWQADGSNIYGSTGSNLVLSQAQVGKAIGVIASYTDSYGTFESVGSSATTKVININDVPIGTVSIIGTTTQGQTLSATNNLLDADGLGTIIYQWRADGSNISGATGNSLSLGQAQVGKVIGVVASYTDGQGTAESVSSAATAKVANFNDAPTGAVTFSGSGLQGETLTATNSIADLDGLGSITYQWLRSGVAINGANAKTYVVSTQDAAESLSVRASYTDGGNTTETVSSKESVLVLPKSNINTSVAKGVISGTTDNDVFDTTLNTTAKYQGGKGDDSYTVNASGIVITESANQGTDTVFAGASYTLPLNVENLKLFGLNDITATGNKSNNLIVGNSANNLISGLEGNDTLTGGAGKDTFVFSTALNAKTNVDTITDFNPGEDLIGLKASIFKKLGVGVEASELWLKNQGSVQTAKQYLIYDSNSGILSYDADGNGKGVATPVAIIGTDLSLVAGDFVVLQ